MGNRAGAFRSTWQPIRKLADLGSKGSRRHQCRAITGAGSKVKYDSNSHTTSTTLCPALT